MLGEEREYIESQKRYYISRKPFRRSLKDLVGASMVSNGAAYDPVYVSEPSIDRCSGSLSYTAFGCSLHHGYEQHWALYTSATGLRASVNRVDLCARWQLTRRAALKMRDPAALMPEVVLCALVLIRR